MFPHNHEYSSAFAKRVAAKSAAHKAVVMTRTIQADAARDRADEMIERSRAQLARIQVRSDSHASACQRR